MRRSLKRALVGQHLSTGRRGSIAAFVLHVEAASGEHVLSYLLQGSEPAVQRRVELGRSKGSDLLGAIARDLAAEYGVPFHEMP